MYNKDIVIKESLEYFNGDHLPTNVWIDKYCLKDKDGNLLEKTPDDMHKRLASEFARIEQNYSNSISEDDIYNLLKNFKYIIPGGSILYGLGNNHSVSSLGNCFVIGNTSDSYGGIMMTDQEQVQLMKRRAGVGHDISHLRPKLSHVSNSAGSSTGAVSFMPRYSNSTREVAQDGRRGALMLSINIEHDDAEDFIESKDDLTKITGANISVKISDLFMKTVEEAKSILHVNRRWKKLIHQAHKSAEPGALFIDTIHKESPAACYGPDWIEISTNPCGEIPLCPYDSCRLLSINMTSYVVNPFTKEAYFDFILFKKHAEIAQKLMDDIIDLEDEKIDLVLKKIDLDPESEDVKTVERNLWNKIRVKLLDGRRTGLSGIGLADVLAMVGLRYDSDEAADFSEEIYKQLAISAYKSSIIMAQERGSFPIWSAIKEKSNPFIDRVVYQELDDDTFNIYEDYGRRNIALLTIPPTGTLGLLAGISSGCEPVFMPIHKRRRKVNPDHPNKSFQDKNGDWWEEYDVFHNGYKQWLDLQPVVLYGETFRSPYYKSSAMEIDPIKKVVMLGRIQKWIDHAISQTTNLPETATEKDVENIYLEAWKNGLKGITVYRDKCRDGVLISSSESKESKFHQHDAPKRPKKLPCDIYCFKKQKYIVLVGKYQNIPYEIFAFNWDLKLPETSGYIKKINSGRYDLIDDSGEILIPNITSSMNQLEEDKTRIISWGLRHGAGLKFAVEQMSKSKNIDITSFTSLVARVLKKYITDGEISSGNCEKCGCKLVYQDGCQSCPNCGNSKCG